MPLINHSFETGSSEMEEIVGIIPPWIIRWGITVLFSIAMLTLAVSCFIRYPDTLNAQVVIEAVNQPGKISIRRGDADQIFKYYVKDGDHVVPDDTLLIWTDRKTGKIHPTITPISGTIYITHGDDEKDILLDIMWVVPQSSKAKIKINYGNKGAGNVKVGQVVKIELHDFPKSEYGFIDGHISSILPIQENGEHVAYVKLKGDEIITSERKIVPILPVMKGTGEILLNDRSIFQRIFGSIFR
ncbi:hypothetical protein SAMN05660461_1403 [Chitinophaga ginsengisegetis]|uniref:HlyD family secretion protein n=1 Tax=Chitinophaga ginsengisegetis TaxID=393003 RepID=A0A1T5NFC6_9BACT|nr:hypothetical protein [Chitinophaga ginsengisegetis]SKC99201.1 hypothetical protein SAMN05660461_1403 [Chitinophaga ginsengisegetis]